MKKKLYFSFFSSSFGDFLLVASDLGLVRVATPLANKSEIIEELTNDYSLEQKNNPILQAAIVQLEEYFSKKRFSFSIPFDIEHYGTEFQNKVWNTLLTIPFGKTVSYIDVAISMDNVGAVRAIGQANKHNPLPIFIPCHRVIGKNGKMVGYSGNKSENLEFKSKLLKFESGNQSSILKYIS